MEKNLLIQGSSDYYYEASLNCDIPGIFIEGKDYHWQGSALYILYMVIAYSNCPYFEVRDYATKKRLGIAYTGTEYTNIQANSIWFGPSKEDDYTLPLLWVSSESEGVIYSFLISNDFTTAELHSKIVLPNTFNGTRLYYINTGYDNSYGKILVGGYDNDSYKYDTESDATYRYYIVSDSKGGEVYNFCAGSEKGDTLTLTSDDFDSIALDPKLTWENISYSQAMTQTACESAFMQAFGNNEDGEGYKNHLVFAYYPSDGSYTNFKSYILDLTPIEKTFGFKKIEGAVMVHGGSNVFPNRILLQAEMPVSSTNSTSQYKLILLDRRAGLPEITEYSIKTIGCTSDKSVAKYGETITITLPEDAVGDKGDYIRLFDHLNIADQDVNEETYSVKDLKFTMPAYDVLITVSYMDTPKEPTKYTIETRDCTSNKSTAQEGETVTITLPENLPFTDLYDHVFFNNLDITNKDTGKSILTPTSLEFTMPACNIVVSVVYRTFNTKYTITTELCSANKQSAEKGDTIILTATGSGTFSHFTVNGEKITGNTFVMPAKDVVCTAVYIQESAKYTITVNGGTSNKSTAKAGETIILTPNNTDNFTYWTVDGVLIEGNTFTMPSKNVVCEAVYNEAPDPTPDPDPDPTPDPDTPNKVTPTKEDVVVYGRIVSGSTEGVVADSRLVYDESLKMNQSEINKIILEILKKNDSLEYQRLLKRS